MDNESQVNGLELRSGRILPSRKVENGHAGPDPQTSKSLDGEYARETAMANLRDMENEFNPTIQNQQLFRNENEWNQETNTTRSSHSNRPESIFGASSCSTSASKVSNRRKRLEAEYRAERAMADVERRVILRRLEVEKAVIDEESENELLLNDVDVSLEKERNHSVHSWVNASCNVPATTQHVNKVTKKPCCLNWDLDTSNDNGSVMKQFLARQGGNRELPNFSGDAQEWPAFITQFRRSTAVCGYSNDENMMRLQRCLKGRAKDTVEALLAVPDNVDIVIRALERRFGRPDDVISSMILKIQSMGPVKEDKMESIIDLSNGIMGLVTTMDCLGQNGHMNNPHLIKELIEKLSPSLRLQWGSIAMDGPVNLKVLSDWLMKIADAASYVCLPVHRAREVPTVTNSKGDGRHPLRKEGIFSTTEPCFDKKLFQCGICSSNSHKTTSCSKLLQLTVEDRWKKVKEKKLCFKCLNRGHNVRDCRSKSVCHIDDCGRDHHNTLHYVNPRTSRPDVRNTPNSNISGGVYSHSSLGNPSKVLLRILPVTLFGPAGKFETHALLDEGSTVTLIDSTAAAKIGASGKRDPLNLRWTNNVSQVDEDSRRISLSICGEDQIEHPLHNVRTVNDLALPVQSVNGLKIQKSWTHLKDYKVPNLSAAKPTILLGQDNCDLIIARAVVEGPKNAPVLSHTKLGWVLHGNMSFHRNRIDADFCFCTWKENKDDLLHELIKESFTTENFGVKVPEKVLLGNKEIRALTILEKTTKRVGHKFESGLLWAENDPFIPESRNAAMKRLLSMERKMDSDPDFAAQYCKKIEEYIQKGYAKILTKEEEMERPTRWFLPHFAVKNVNKPGKIRFVFDAASKSYGVSLNDLLLKGPDFLTPLTSVIFKFRQREVGFSGDIREMFHQVNIIEKDRSSQRFLWRGTDRTENPKVYEMQVMIFGATSSPTTAQFVKNRNAAEHRNVEPEAAKAISERHYVDDYLDSTHTEDEAIKLIKSVTRVHKKGGFEIRSWTCSSKKVLEAIPSEFRAVSENQIIWNGDLLIERVLGMRWNANKDEFGFLVKNQTVLGDKSRSPTKREVLRLVMSLFDPLGFLSNYIIRAKILLQDVWRSSIGWDDELAGDSLVKWTEWISQLGEVETVTIPRCYSNNMKTSKSLQLHVFCDASEQAFASVAYLRSQSTHVVDVAFLMGKTRVAPLRRMSIPRMELQAAVMGTRLAATIIKEHDLKIDQTYFWTDSQTVLCWIKSDARKFKPFVSHRVGEILETSEVADWRWVPTAENVADDGTRDIKPAELNPRSRWLRGPMFLRLPENEWPKEKSSKADSVPVFNLELKKEFVALTTPPTSDALPDVRRFSSWNRLIRATAYVKKFADMCRKTSSLRNVDPDLSVSDLEDAEQRWIITSQMDSFAAEVNLLTTKKPIYTKSRLLSLNPYIDDSGLVRVRGRLEKSDLTLQTKRPIILDPKHPYTVLLIKRYHEMSSHCGQETVLNELRQKYWILDSRAAVRTAWNNCNLCKLRRAKPMIPQMAPLPPCRLASYVRPFTYTGVDYFGPMLVTIKRRKEKRYGIFFTCLSTRAVHIEVAASLTSDSCLMAIRRFISRRGQPLELFSDNGKNFQGAGRELKAAMKEVDHNEIYRKLAIKMIKWNFLPPVTPHMGGAWERLVRSIKTALRVTLTEMAPKEEVLLTLISEAEAVVNSRPLTHVSLDHEDAEALTPNHFLLGSSSLAPSNGNATFLGKNLRKQWKLAQTLADQFWMRWIKEYLPTLARRTKWFRPVDPLKVGDIVIIADGSMPRTCWLRGKVEKVYPGSDGQVRVADVKTIFGTYRRSVAKLCILDINVDEDS